MIENHLADDFLWEQYRRKEEEEDDERIEDE